MLGCQEERENRGREKERAEMERGDEKHMTRDRRSRQDKKMKKKILSSR
jgi:hypothetical protein